MARALSSRFVAAVGAQQTSEVVLTFIDLNFAGNHIYVVDDTQAQTYNGATYQPFPFQITLPQDVDGNLPTAALMIDNVDLSIMTQLQSITTYPTATVYVMLASQIGTLELPAMTFNMRDLKYDSETITATLSLNSAFDEPFPGDSMTPASFPYLFITPPTP